MSCGEPAFYTFFGTGEEMKQQLEESSMVADLEYFQRKVMEATGLPESYMLNGAVPLSKEHIADQQYLDQQIANNSVPVTIDNMEQFDSYFGQPEPVPGSMFLDNATDDSIDKLLMYDGNDWGVIQEFDMFTVEMVKEPLCFGATIQLTSEEKYDNAMAGI